MADSDSDLEILEEVPSQRPPGRPAYHGDDVDEPLILEDYVGNTSGAAGRRRSSRSSFKRRSQSPLITAKKTLKKGKSSSSKGLGDVKKVCEKEVDLTLSDDDDKESVATEKIGEDSDLESLPSIPPPSPKVVELVEDFEDDYDLREWNRGDPNSSGGTATMSKSSSRNSLYEDPGAQEIDEMFQDIEYMSLADYLAEMDKKKKPSPAVKKSSDKSKRPSTSTSSAFGASTSSASTAASSSGFGLKPAPVPSTSTFARQQQSTFSKSKAETMKNSEATEKPIKSYQMNGKANAKERKKATPKKKGPATSKSAVTFPVPSSSSSSSAQAQGPVRQKQPKDVLKMIVLHVAENVISDEIAAKLIEKEIQFKIIEQPEIANSVLFEHNVAYKMVEKDLQVHEKVLKEIDGNILIIFPIEQHLEHLQAELDRREPSKTSCSECLTEWIQKIQRKDSKRKITLLVHGLTPYLRKLQRVAQKEYRDRVLHGDKPDNGKKKKKGKSQGISLSRFEVQNALISTQLATHINYRFYESSSDLALFLLQYAKAVAEAPYKQDKLKANDFDWYAVADAVGGIPVDEKGQGMRSLWLAQLQQFPKVGQESALAIARVYGSPRELCKAYRRCGSVQEGKDLLTNVKVTMGVGPLAKTRRLGPEASKKIYRFFTATDGEREVDGS